MEGTAASIDTGNLLVGGTSCAMGVDIGSAYVSLAVIDNSGGMIHHDYRRHHGKVVETVSKVIADTPNLGFDRVAKTGDGAAQIQEAGPLLDPAVAILYGARQLYPEVRNVIYVGAGSFYLVMLNEQGEYLKHTANTACASGTGAFLDQQASRLGSTPEELHELAAAAQSCPPVATRCAVFAKTDIIHLQQCGYGQEEIAAGICRGMAESTLDTLLKGKTLIGETVVIGGVARNSAIIKYLTEKLGFPVQVPEHPELVGALGVAVYASAEGQLIVPGWRIRKAATDQSARLRRPALKLERSEYPDFTSFDSWINDDESEITLPTKPRAGTHRVVLGIDIGSTSTKAVAMGPAHEPLITIYRKTAGAPIRATQLLFKGIREAAAKYELDLDIVASGTTGSGRKLIKSILRADLEMNEITAHARAAIHLDPEVDTILEIGGQDSKFTQLEDGVVYNSVMNHVCAAGTGSFIEEQAKRLNISIWDYGDKVLGVAPPRTSDRCTVFMERDLDVLLAQGWSRKEVAASVLYSVCENYLNKVVAGQHIGEHVYFQGATARNKALIAAFEQTLGKRITVSHYCHLTGAYGIALLLLDKFPEHTSFPGLAFADSDVQPQNQTCTFCRNECELTVTDVAGEKVGWGMKCGKEYAETKRVVNKTPNYDLFRLRAKLLKEHAGTDPDQPAFTFGIPNSLTTYSFLPLWAHFLRELGGRLVLTKPTSEETRKRGLHFTQADFCAPVIASHGHVAELAALQPDMIFMPHMIRVRPAKVFSDTHFCPFVQSHPSVIKATNLLNDYDGKVVTPVVRYTNGAQGLADELYDKLKDVISITPRQVRAALQAALAAQSAFESEVKAAGRETLKRLRRDEQMGIVVLGRPYNVNDSGINVDLPRKIAEMGVTVIPMDFLPEGELEERWYNMYWNYGQTIVRTARTVLDSDNLFGILFSNFCCGPDSYLMTYFKEIMNERRKPFLTVQFDAHGADAGYVTRVEAAMESFKSWQPRPRLAPATPRKRRQIDANKTVFFAPMDPLGVRLFAAAFQSEGYQVAILREDEETLDIGYKHTLGGECVPCPSTLGSFIKTVEDRGLKPHQAALFMPTAHGPCRFGQYACLDHLLLKKKGWGDVEIISPSAENSYAGLPGRMRRLMWRGLVCSDVITKMMLKTRPYEKHPGTTDLAAEESVIELIECLQAGGKGLPDKLGNAVDRFRAIETVRQQRPSIGIVGEIYVRNNVFINQNVVGCIEELGGEAIRTSVAEWVQYTAFMHRHKAINDPWNLVQRAKAEMSKHYFAKSEHDLFAIADELIHDRMEPPIEDIIRAGQRYLPVEFEGEAILTIGRTLIYIEEEGVDAVVNVSPTFCMPGTTTSSIFAKIEDEKGVPIICNFYDGSGDPNKVLRPHLHCLTRRQGSKDVSVETDVPRSIST